MTRPPGAVSAVITTTAALALVLTLPFLSATPRAPGGLGERGALLGVLVLAGTLQVHVRHRNRTTEAYDLFWVALAVCAVAFPPAVLVAAAGLAKAASQGLLRVDPVKGTFNTVMTAATAAAIGATLAVLPAEGGLLAALALALAAGWVVNHLALVAVVTAAGVRREVVTWRALGRWATHGVATCSLGILLAVAWSADPATVVLFVVPALVLHAAGRALVSAAGERRRLSAGAAASRLLSSSAGTDDRGLLQEYCAQVAGALGARDACLLTGPGESPVVVGAGISSWVRRALTEVTDDEPVHLQFDAGEVSEVLAARLPGHDGTLLAVADPTGSRERPAVELAFLATTASELESFLRAQRLRALADATLARLETVVGAVADGIVTVDATGRVLAMNQAGGRITGHDPARLGPRSHLDVLGLQRPDGTAWEPDVSGERAARVQVRPPDGTLRHVDVSVAPAVLDDAPGAVLVLRDVSADVERDRTRTRFLVGLGHELRTPLTPLQGWAQTLRRRPEILDGPKRETMVTALETQTARLVRLVDNLLTAVDPQAMLGERRTVDLVSLAQQEVTSAGPLLGPRRVQVRADGPVPLETSPMAVRHVLNNLLANVARYVPETGTATVLIGLRDGSARLTVVDDGPGVPPDRREAVFNLFTHGTSGEANPGAGVGLTTSRTLARALGGDLTCTDPAGVPGGGTGAAFQLVLPLQPVSATASGGLATDFLD